MRDERDPKGLLMSLYLWAEAGIRRAGFPPIDEQTKFSVPTKCPSP